MSCGLGAALLSHPQLIHDCISSAKRNIPNLPVSAKIRLCLQTRETMGNVGNVGNVGNGGNIDNIINNVNKQENNIKTNEREKNIMGQIGIINNEEEIEEIMGGGSRYNNNNNVINNNNNSNIIINNNNNNPPIDPLSSLSSLETDIYNSTVLPANEFKWTHNRKNPIDINATIELVKTLEHAGVDFITIHGRTSADAAAGVAVCKKGIKMVKETASVPVVGNGDIFTVDDARTMVEYTKVWKEREKIFLFYLLFYYLFIILFYLFIYI